MRTFDPTVGPRAALYAHFRRFAWPMFTISSPIRVDTARLRQTGGVFPNLLWAVLDAANAVPELRQRIRIDGDGEQIVEHERVHCTSTVLREDGSFDFCAFEHAEREEFVAGVKARIDAVAGAGLDRSAEGRDDLLYLSSMPWIDISGHAPALPGDPLDCVPRILWGRVVEDRMTLCVTAHHALVDGLHVARFVQELQRRLGRREGEGLPQAGGSR